FLILLGHIDLLQKVSSIQSGLDTIDLEKEKFQPV
ncbi:hypothetical protein Csa_023727, partial [Cucumis sativus]